MVPGTREVRSAMFDGALAGRRKAREEMTTFQDKLAQTQQLRAYELQQELDEQGRPKMQAEVQGMQQIADLSQQMAREGMPEAQRQAAAGDIQASQAMALGGASGLGAGLRGLGTTQATTAQQYRDLNAMDVEMARQNQMQYLNALAGLTGAQTRAEGYNTLLPYEQKVAEMQSLLGSSIQNRFGSLSATYEDEAQKAQMMVDAITSSTQVAAPIAMQAVSDIRLKQDIVKHGVSESGIPIYSWGYKTNPQERFTGTMAQDLLKMGKNDAVVVLDSGYYGVDYSKIDVEFKKVN